MCISQAGLHRCFCRQGRPEMWCDITLWVGEEQLPAHRALLACRSRTFRRLLTSKWLPHVRTHSVLSAVHN